MKRSIDIYYDPRLQLYYLEVDGVDLPAAPVQTIIKDLQDLDAETPDGSDLLRFLQTLPNNPDRHGRLLVDSSLLSPYGQQGVVLESLGFRRLKTLLEG